MAGNDKKESVSINICIGPELFDLLTKYCAITGQSKTIAVERAIEAYCCENGKMVDSNNGEDV